MIEKRSSYSIRYLCTRISLHTFSKSLQALANFK